MATSVRDILTTIESTIRVAQRGDKQAVDDALRGLTVINEIIGDVAGRYAITRAPFDPGDDQHRSTLIEQLRRHTTQLRLAGIPGTEARPLTDLLQVARDILAIQTADRPSVHAHAEDRWRTAAAITTVAGPLATLALSRSQPRQRAAALRSITGLAGAIRAITAHDPALRRAPQPTLDRTIPLEQLPPRLPGSRVAAEALSIVVHRIDGSIRGTQPRITLADGLAAIRLGASASAYCQAISTHKTASAETPTLDAAEVWRHAGALLSKYTDGHSPNREPSKTQRFALLALDGLRTQFGPSTDFTPPAPPSLPHQALDDLERIANELPQLADAISVESYRWGETQTLIIRARHAQLRENRVEAHLTNRAVIADRGDLGPIIDTLATARTRNTALAVDLAQSSPPPAQPDFTGHYEGLRHQDQLPPGRTAIFPEHTAYLPDTDIRPGESTQPIRTFDSIDAEPTGVSRHPNRGFPDLRELQQMLHNIEATKRLAADPAPHHSAPTRDPSR